MAKTWSKLPELLKFVTCNSKNSELEHFLTYLIAKQEKQKTDPEKLQFLLHFKTSTDRKMQETVWHSIRKHNLQPQVDTLDGNIKIYLCNFPSRNSNEKEIISL